MSAYGCDIDQTVAVTICEITLWKPCGIYALCMNY